MRRQGERNMQWGTGGETAGIGGQEYGDNGKERGNTQVVGVPHAEDRYAGMDMGNAQVGSGTRAGEMEGVGASGWDEWGRSGDWGQGGG